MPASGRPTWTRWPPVNFPADGDGVSADQKLARVILWQTFLVQLMAAIAIFTIPVLATEIARDLALDPVAAGFYTATLFTGAIIGSAAAARVTRLIGAFVGSLTALVLIAVGIGLLATANLVILAPAVLLAGFGYGLVNPTASALLVRVTRPERRGWVFSVKQTGIPIGSAVGGFVAPPMAHALGLAGDTARDLGRLHTLDLAVRAECGEVDARGACTWRAVRGRHPVAAALPGPPDPGTWFAGPGRPAALPGDLPHRTSGSQRRIGPGRRRPGVRLLADRRRGRPSLVGQGRRLVRWARTLCVVGILGSIAGFFAAALDPGWPIPAMVTLATVFGATSLAWNGVFFAEIVRIVRPEEVAAATGGAQLFTYTGIMAGPLLFAAVASLAGAFGPAYAVLAAVALPGAIAIGGVGRTT